MDNTMDRVDAVVVEKDVVTVPSVIPNVIRRISWGAIIAGIVIALVIQLGLNLLGLSIGANSINLLNENEPVAGGLGTGAVIWLAATTLISLFLGGLVAGRLAGMTDALDGILHGLVVWGIVTIITILLLISGVGSVLNAFGNIAGEGIRLVSEGVDETAPEIAQALNLQDLTLQDVVNEAEALLLATDNEDLEPGDVAESADETAEDIQESAEDVVRNPATLDEEFNQTLNNILLRGEEFAREVDREAVVNVLVEEGGLGEQEARETLSNWEQTYAQVVADAEDAIRQAGQAIADTVAALAGVLFAAMILGAFAAGAGGLIGSPDTPPNVVAVEAA